MYLPVVSMVSCQNIIILRFPALEIAKTCWPSILWIFPPLLISVEDMKRSRLLNLLLVLPNYVWEGELNRFL